MSLKMSMLRATPLPPQNKPSISLGLGENAHANLVELLSAFFKGILMSINVSMSLLIIHGSQITVISQFK